MLSLGESESTKMDTESLHTVLAMLGWSLWITVRVGGLSGLLGLGQWLLPKKQENRCIVGVLYAGDL